MRKMRKNKYGIPSRIKIDGVWKTNPAYRSLLQKELRKKYPERYKEYGRRSTLKPGYQARKNKNMREWRAKNRPLVNLKQRTVYYPRKAKKRKMMLENGMIKEETGCKPLRVRELNRIVARKTTREQYKYLVYGNGITAEKAYPEEYKKRTEMNVIV